MTEDYPAIRSQAVAEDVIIFFLDESAAKSDAHRGRTWGQRGRTPRVKVTGARHRPNLISTVSSEGLLRYKTFTGKLDQWAFIGFLKSPLKSDRKPVIIITDGHPAHRAKSVRAFVEKEPRLLGLHLLPSYSPELNPDELAWNYLKEKLGKVALKTKHDFILFIRRAMKRRLHLIPFTVKVPDEKKDRELPNKLLAQRNGILAWVIDGCLRWQREGIKPPDSAVKAPQAYFEAEDYLGQWLGERCELSAITREGVAQLFADWRTWNEDQGQHPGTIKRFSEALQSRDFDKCRTTTGHRGLMGLSLRPQPFVKLGRYPSET